MTDAESGNESRLGAVLRELGVAQSRFAELTGQDRAVISKWVTGAREPRKNSKIIVLTVLRDLGWQGTSTDLWPVDETDYQSSCTRGHD